MAIDPKFQESIDPDGRLSEDYVGPVYRYVRYGLQPGGMFTSIIANDFHSAVCRSHPLNDWNQLQRIAKWFVHYAPNACYGTYDSVKVWGQLDQKQRDDMLLSKGLIRNLFDVIKDA